VEVRKFSTFLLLYAVGVGIISGIYQSMAVHPSHKGIDDFMRASTKVDLRLGNRPYYPELAGLGDAIASDLKSGIPGYSPIDAANWAKKFGHGLIDNNAISAMIRLNRMPSIEVLVRLGYLMKQAGADVQIYDYLLIAADGIWAKLSECFESDENPSHNGQAIPHKADVAVTVDFVTRTYAELPWVDRMAAMHPLLQSISRDVKLAAMTDDLEIIQELVREAFHSHQTIGAFAARVDVPPEWVRNILDGRWDEVRDEATIGMVLKLSDKVKDMDGRTGSADFFAPLLSKEFRKAYIKEVKKGGK
jgi:hypothetical protein